MLGGVCGLAFFPVKTEAQKAGASVRVLPLFAATAFHCAPPACFWARNPGCTAREVAGRIEEHGKTPPPLVFQGQRLYTGAIIVEREDALWKQE